MLNFNEYSTEQYCEWLKAWGAQFKKEDRTKHFYEWCVNAYQLLMHGNSIDLGFSQSEQDVIKGLEYIAAQFTDYHQKYGNANTGLMIDRCSSLFSHIAQMIENPPLKLKINQGQISMF